MNNPYKVLGVSEGASQEEIRAAYLKYLPALLATAVGFGLAMLLMYFWLS